MFAMRPYAFFCQFGFRTFPRVSPSSLARDRTYVSFVSQSGNPLEVSVRSEQRLHLRHVERRVLNYVELYGDDPYFVIIETFRIASMILPHCTFGAVVLRKT